MYKGAGNQNVWNIREELPNPFAGEFRVVRYAGQEGPVTGRDSGMLGEPGCHVCFAALRC